MRTFLMLAFLAVLTAHTACQQGTKTEHGYRFINHTNKGGQKPQPGESCLIQTYTYIGDSLMASTQKNFGGPREFTLFTADKLPKRVPAIYDALLLSSEGDSVTVYETIDSFLQKFIPPALKDEKEVRYEVVLVDVITADEKAKALQEAQARIAGIGVQVKTTATDYVAGKLKDKLTASASGLKTLVVEKGNGAPVKQGEQIKTHYYGVLTNGSMFDNSFERGQPLPFAAGVGQMIAGFDEGVLQLNHGGKAYFFIPSKLGYGEQGQGTIPPNSELIFYVEVL